MSTAVIRSNYDVSVGSGQLGLAVTATITTNITLWTAFPTRPTFYNLSSAGGTQILTLPAATTGHHIHISNNGSGIFNAQFGVSTIAIIRPGNSTTLLKTTTSWVIVANLTASGLNLQTAYDNSNALGANPQISIGTTLNLGNMLQVGVGSVGIFGAPPAPGNTLAVGTGINVDSSNTAVFTDSGVNVSGLPPAFTTAYEGGILQLGGRRDGYNGCNIRESLYEENTDGAGVGKLLLLKSSDIETISIKVWATVIVVRPDALILNDSAMIDVEGRVRCESGTITLPNPQTFTIDADPNMNTTLLEIIPSGSELYLFLTPPLTVGGDTINWNIIVTMTRRRIA